MEKRSKIKLLDLVYGFAFLLFLFLTFTSKKGDIASIFINIVLFIVVFWIFFNAKKAMTIIVNIENDLKKATKKIVEDFEQENTYLWDKYRIANVEDLFQNEHLLVVYKKYVKERNRLAEISENKYKCDISNYINEELIDSLMKKNIYNLVPGVMTGLGILGTFIGLSLGLQNFNTGNTEEIEASIAPLMNGIKVAFHTSIYGMLFSLFFNYVYKGILEDSYIAVDEFLKTFDSYVDSNALDNNGVEIQQLLKNMPETVGVTVANILTPTLDKMNETLEDLGKNISKNHMKGLSEIVDHFIRSMNASLGDSFKALGDTIDKTIELQNRNNDTMNNILDKIQGMTQNIVDINMLTNQTVERMKGYVESIDELQKIINANFESFSVQLEEQKEYDKKMKEYIEILVKYEQEISEASNRFTKDVSKQMEIIGKFEENLSENAKKHLNMIIQKTEDYNKSLSEVVKKEVESVLSMVDSYTEKVTGYLNSLENRSDQILNKSMDSIQFIFENTEKQNKTLFENIEKQNKALFENTERQNKILFENAEEQNKLLSLSAQSYTDKLAEEAEKQINSIFKISADKANEMEISSRNLLEASKEFNNKLNISLNNAFNAIDENLAEITRHLSGTIYEIDQTTGRVPKVIKTSYAGMKNCLEEMKQKYEELLHTLDVIVQISEQKINDLEG